MYEQVLSLIHTTHRGVSDSAQQGLSGRLPRWESLPIKVSPHLALDGPG
jgi:hypothetical protein